MLLFPRIRKKCRRSYSWAFVLKNKERVPVNGENHGSNVKYGSCSKCLFFLLLARTNCRNDALIRLGKICTQSSERPTWSLNREPTKFACNIASWKVKKWSDRKFYLISTSSNPTSRAWEKARRLRWPRKNFIKQIEMILIFLVLFHQNFLHFLVT